MTTFSKVGYIKGLDDSELGQYPRAVLKTLGAYCANDMTVPFGDFTAAGIAKRLDCAPSTVEKAIRLLKDARLLTKVTKKRLQHWKLPSEDAIAAYIQPKPKKVMEQVRAVARSYERVFLTEIKP